MASTVTDTVESTITTAPPPWECHGHAWWFIAWPMTSKPIYPGSCHPADFHDGVNDNFHSFLGMIQVVRYTSTPVGPYDEILYIPGHFSTPHSTSPRYRITNIYVSKPESVYNGRHNWNIPKHLAVFNFDTSETTGQTTITVAHPESPESPFFVAVVKDIPLVSRISIPFSTTFFPMNLDFHQPDLRGVETEEGKKNGETATEGWKMVTFWQGGKVRVLKLVEIKNGNGDGRWPDRIDGLWGISLKWDDIQLNFNVPKELGENARL
ncbi:hypothetical protein ABW19_dt0205616 [Dactylella cylindrospora]|nr:hypothetical protein ABW19_dt0205616 [Dactylella cylindrospora]